MGAFSSKTRTFVASTSAPLSVADAIPVISSVMESILDDKSTTETILRNELQSSSREIDRLYQYAVSDYTLGLPQGTMEIGRGNDVAVKAVLDAIEGEPVTLISNVLDSFNPEAWALDYMLNNRAYNPNTNIVGNPHQPKPQTIYYAGAALSATRDSVNVFTSYTTTVHITDSEGGMSINQMTHTQTETVPLGFTVGLTDIFYIVNYSVGGTEKYWFYNEALGTYPTLDIADGTSLSSPFYPIVPIRHHNVDKTDPTLKGTAQYDTSKEMLRRGGIDFSALGDLVNENPDIADIDHAFVYFGVDLHTENKRSQAYLAEFFAYLEGTSTYTKANYTAWSAGSRANPPPINTLKIEDGGLKIKIHYNYIDSQIKTGVIGNPGEGTRTTNIQPLFTQVQEVYDGEAGTMTAFAYDTEMSSVTFRKQVNDTQYLEVEVKGLLHVNYVYGHHTVETTIAMSAEADPDKEDKNFIIPLNRFVVEQMPLMERNLLYGDAIHMIFNSYVRVKLKWYQTGWFKFIVVVVAVVLTAYGMGQFGAALYSAAQAGAMALIKFLVTAIVISLAVTYAVDKFIDLFGLENTFIAMVIATAAAIYVAATTGDTTGLMITAEQMMWAVGALGAGIQRQVTDDMNDLLSTNAAIMAEVEEKQDYLEDLYNELDTVSDLIDPFKFIAAPSYFSPDEDPDAFYTRTIHSGNIGVLSLDAVSTFVQDKVKLPPTKPSYGRDLFGELVNV